jgi:hypothetical protein
MFTSIPFIENINSNNSNDDSTETGITNKGTKATPIEISTALLMNIQSNISTKDIRTVFTTTGSLSSSSLIFVV